ncbi:hypothetical protein ATE84_0082 [Aquimarina sp. MAR_2010_214]|uniref:hypothetical protein n=1 Tax=Aquimarina sp. MAR_2010_214 TaxID=1250026 RepID=UPI000C70D918|nr:hypothetical protein [Aquimarina sp. MAR_2010_214]PKV48094.1 hypothetical protein ATE84_0082 [Aquimarina sp. MAR_2010_214]
MKTRLDKAIDNLYNVFSKYHLDVIKLRDHSCPCCVTDEEIREIVMKPLKQLSENELGHFSRSAISTFGTIEDYKHFLPRILELMQYPKSDFLFDFTYFEKLNYSEWETWPIEEQNAIEDYFTVLWYSIINDKNTTDYQIDGVLDIILKYGYLDMALSEWSKSETLKSTLFIVEGVLNGFNFKLSDKKYNKVSEWLSSEIVLSKVEDIFFKTENAALANRIVIAHTILENKYTITFS